MGGVDFEIIAMPAKKRKKRKKIGSRKGVMRRGELDVVGGDAASVEGGFDGGGAASGEGVVECSG